MAQMQSTPDSIKNEDERKIYELLDRQLTDDRWIVWHEPEVRRRAGDKPAYRPDFILLHPDRGLFVLEVKGWRWDSIEGYAKPRRAKSHAGPPMRQYHRGRPEYEVRDGSPRPPGRQQPRKAKYRFGGVTEEVEIPEDQLRKYKAEIRNKLKDYLRDLVSQKRIGGILGGNVLFVRISKYRDLEGLFAQGRLDEERHKIVASGKAFYEEELSRWKQSRGRLVHDVSIDSDATLALGDEALSQIRRALHPESEIHPFDATRSKPVVDRSTAERHPQPNPPRTNPPVLDLEQERVARNHVGSGHRILFGVAGSGKTVILIARAAYQAQRYPDQRILVLCFNKALSLYLERALDQYRGSIRVSTFPAWASKEFRLQDYKEREPDEVYNEALLEHLKVNGATSKYDCILIDESQDWDMRWFRAVLHAAKDPLNGDLLVAGDGSQTLYSRHQGFSWSKCGIQARGRVVNRRGGRVNTFRNYRNAPEIVELATHFAKPYVSRRTDADMLSLLPDPSESAKAPTGFLPTICRFSSPADELQAVGHAVERLVSRGRYDTPEIAILCPKSKPWQKEHILPLVNRLNQGRARATWINTDAKNHKAVLGSSISVVSAQLVKGLEFKVCFVVGGDQFRPDEAELMYVALTRATDRLCVSGSWGAVPDVMRRLVSNARLFVDGRGEVDRRAWIGGLLPRESVVSIRTGAVGEHPHVGAG